MEAFIFLQVQVGTDASVARGAMDLPGVVAVDVVNGPHDLVIRAEADSIDELGKRVLRPLQQLDGVARTLTCPIMRRWTWLVDPPGPDRG
ncbi:MAG TPA: Lrp/AsnC ligand binding domain-containing protein [Actinomycetota bacterium]|jgi:DNA-binding Lrp family transcriptional regulator|nr:Lrp/AsnC ligand binding domain-containing protein [Actinomycetota bacterium]